MCFVWVAESIASHRLKKIIFAFDAVEILGALLRPKAWPNFQFQANEMLRALSSFDDWRVEAVDMATNKDAFLIAQSVNKDNRFHSYVATGGLLWLSVLFEDEKGSPSV